MRTFFTTLSIALILHLQFSLMALAYTYTVKDGDTLSESIASTLIPGPVWGPKGSLAKVLLLNPQIKNENFILPGDRIELGDLISAKARADKNVVTSVAPAAACNPEPIREALPEVKSETAVSPRVPSSDFKRGSRVSITPYYVNTTLSVTDNSSGAVSSIGSEFGAGARGEYSQRWSKKFQSFVGLGIGTVIFEAPTNPGINFNDRGKILSSLSVGGTYAFTDDFNLTATAGDDTEMFARANSTSSIAVDTINLPSFQLKASYDLIALDPFIFGVSGVSKVIFPGNTDSYHVNLGMLYGGIIYLRDQKDEVPEDNIQTEVGVFTRSQNTALVHQTETDLTLSVRIFLGGPKIK